MNKEDGEEREIEEKEWMEWLKGKGVVVGRGVR